MINLTKADAGAAMDDLFSAVMPGLIAQKAREDHRKKLVAQREAEELLIGRDRRNAATITTGRDAGGLTWEQRQTLRAKVLLWEAEATWEPVSFMVLEETAECLHCGVKTPHIVGLYQHQYQKTNFQNTRLVLWEPLVPAESSLPKFVMSVARQVPVCPCCRGLQGFVAHKAVEQDTPIEQAPAKLETQLLVLEEELLAAETKLRELRGEQRKIKVSNQEDWDKLQRTRKLLGEAMERVTGKPTAIGASASPSLVDFL